MVSTIVPPTDFALATPIVYIDIYPSGTKPSNVITLTPSNSGLISLTTQKYIRGDANSGRFDFTLAPGGLNGVDDPITWTSVLPQYSLCVIYASRGQSKAILLVGLISDIEENQEWTNEKVRRTITVRGFDLTLYFSTFAYYVLDYLGLINTLPGLFGLAGSTILSNKGTLMTSPDKLGAEWFTDQLVGNTGIPGATAATLQNTTIAYRGQNIPLSSILTYWFESFTTLLGTTVIIPILTNFLISEGTFYDKFIQIFPFPFYEFFVNTVPSGYYPQAVTPITSIQPQIQGFGTADIVTVARVNPLPTLDVTATGSTFLRRDKWDALNLYQLFPYSFISSEVSYKIDDIKNFFVIAPIGPLTAPGGAPGNNLAPAIEQMGYMYDQSSVEKYGFRSEVESIIWWVDPFDTIYASSSIKVSGGISTADIPSEIQYESFLYKVASYYTPIPNMLYGQVRLPLWPEIVVGNKFEYFPFKNAIPYTFYITGVEHTYTYGADSSTTLYLERGLPSSIYADSTSNLLLKIHAGQAERISGTIVPASGIGLVYANIFTTDPFNSSPGPGSFGVGASIAPPTNTNNSFDDDFKAAAAATPCGAAGIDWRVLKALAMTESTPLLDQTSKNQFIDPNTHMVVYTYGIMQVASNAGFDNARLQSDPNYNIKSGAIVLCQKLNTAFGNMHNALAFYKGSTPLGYNDPKVQGLVNNVIQWAYNMGVTSIS